MAPLRRSQRLSSSRPPEASHTRAGAGAGRGSTVKVLYNRKGRERMENPRKHHQHGTGLIGIVWSVDVGPPFRVLGAWGWHLQSCLGD